VEKAAAVGHVVLGGILGPVVIVEAVDESEVEKKLVECPAKSRVSQVVSTFLPNIRK
jgi:hypothetical protein